MNSCHRKFVLFGALFSTLLFGQDKELPPVPNDILAIRNTSDRLKALRRIGPESYELLFNRYRSIPDVAYRRAAALDLAVSVPGDDRYFSEIATWAARAVEDGAPSFYQFDSSGKAVKGASSREFSEWCAKQGEAFNQCALRRLQEFPQDVLRLALLADPRAEPILRKGLKSANLQIIVYSASGLGVLGKNDVIGDIEQIASLLPNEGRGAIAMSLFEFDDIRAALACDRFFPDKAKHDVYRQLGVGASRKKLLQR